MHTLSTLEFFTRLAVGLGCGALIGAERQWRARRAGLRTNALVATGATLFVLYSDISGTANSTQVAAYVVSGIGFLGGGVILRDGFNMRGLNTAATLWCSAAAGVLAASGHLAFAVIGTLLACWTPPGPGLVLLLCWPQRPRSAVAPALRTRPCHTGTRTRPRLSTPAIFTRCRRPPEDRLPPATAGLPAIPLPPRPGRE